jgi:hypothetical protein
VPFRRDPVSVYFDSAASKALRASLRRRGQWVPVHVPQLSPRASVACLRAGINPYGDDGTGVSRTVRGFVRALYYAHRHDEAQQGIWLAWRPAGSRPGGWGIDIMTDRAGSPSIKHRGTPVTWPPSGPAALDHRDWQ